MDLSLSNYIGDVEKYVDKLYDRLNAIIVAYNTLNENVQNENNLKFINSNYITWSEFRDKVRSYENENSQISELKLIYVNDTDLGTSLSINMAVKKLVIFASLHPLSYCFGGGFQLHNVDPHSPFPAEVELNLTIYNNSFDFNYMFNSLEKINSIQLNIIYSNYTRISGFQSLCAGCRELTDCTITFTNSTGVPYDLKIEDNDFSNMFQGCWKLQNLSIDSIMNIPSLFDILVENLNFSSFFEDCNELKNYGEFASTGTGVNLNTWRVISENIVNMKYMFRNCFELSAVDMQQWKITNCLNFDSLFENCYILKNIYIHEWHFNENASVTDMFKNVGKNLQSTEYVHIIAYGATIKFLINSNSSLKASEEVMRNVVDNTKYNFVGKFKKESAELTYGYVEIIQIE